MYVCMYVRTIRKEYKKTNNRYISMQYTCSPKPVARLMYIMNNFLFAGGRMGDDDDAAGTTQRA